MRAITGRGSTELPDATALAHINDYYQYDFPIDVDLDHLDTSWTQALAATDDGEYAVSDGVIQITQPVMLNGTDELRVWDDQEDFWRRYPANEDYLTAPTLVVGTSNAAHVKNSEFTYSVSGYQYTKAAAETALSGDAVPEDKYGAWMLSVDADGDVTITEASDNATGYASPCKAIEAIPTAGVTDAIMGFVTAICSSGAFTPGTTELNTGASVTATFTDGNPALRGRPEAILLTLNEGKVWVRPKPDDIYLVKAQAVLTRPTAFSDDADTPADESWGLALAIGAAIKYLSSKEGNRDRVMELMNGDTPGCLKYELAKIRSKQLLGQNPVIQRYW